MSLPLEIVMPGDGAANPFTISRLEHHLPLRDRFGDHCSRRACADVEKSGLGGCGTRSDHRTRVDFSPANKLVPGPGLYGHDARQDRALRGPDDGVVELHNRRSIVAFKRSRCC